MKRVSELLGIDLPLDARVWHRPRVLKGPRARFPFLADAALQNIRALLEVHGGPCAGFRFRRRAIEFEEFAPHRARSMYKSGFSIRLRHVEDWVPSLRLFLQRLEYDLKLPAGSVTSGAFAVARGAALPPHFDEDDVFNIQISGTKIWRIAPASTVSRAAHHWVVGSPCKAALARYWKGTPPDGMPVDSMTITAGPGDVAYLPAGTLHTTNRGQRSFSISIEIRDLTIAAQFGEILLRHPAFRERLFLADPSRIPAVPKVDNLRRTLPGLLEDRRRLERSYCRTAGPVLDTRRWIVRAGDRQIRVATRCRELVDWIFSQRSDFDEADAVYGSDLSPANVQHVLDELVDSAIIRRA